MSLGGVPHVQKEAALIIYDQIPKFLLSSALALGLLFACAGPSLAANAEAGATATQPADPAEATGSIGVSLLRNGTEVGLTTSARTVGDLLTEQNLRVAPNDFIVPAPDTPISEGLRIEYRAAVPIQLYVDAGKRLVRTSAASVAELLASEHVKIGERDAVHPGLDAALDRNAIVQVAHVASWTAHVRQRITPLVRRRDDARLELGATRVLDAGRMGERETLYRFVRRGAHAPEKTVLATRIVRASRAKVIVRGIATYTSFARLAEQGFSSAVHFAGSALHMIATAYSAGCYGCSGITASGARAGFGVIAVDPSVIPLGTRVFVPGYGRAIAGDTGGAIHGNRIDLGMNDGADATRFGRRPVTLYVLR